MRQTEGLVGSILAVLKVAGAGADHSTLRRRRATLAVAVPRTRGTAALPVVVASTGMKVFGAGEGQVVSPATPTGAPGARGLWGGRKQAERLWRPS